ncbi:MAG TPA: sugar transferase [Ktedonobacterales bacterium]|nr:sugar transferase [Ktedonobacterales bacterium]
MVAQEVLVRDDISIEGRYLRLKRAMDVVLTVMALIPISVVMLVTAIIIRLDSPGPAIYRQTRYGVNGQRFTFYKFRSMYQNVASDVHEKATATFMDGAGELNRGDKEMPYKLGDDSRVTRVGRFIRKTSIDELPQLWNILKGDMSIVGPRPPVEYEIKRYSARHFLRLTGKPGLTGTWQVFGRGRVTFEEMIDQDISYLETQSLIYDLKLMVLTVPVMITGRGGA